ncbi:zinc-dependent alcohol dehydrogenase [Brevibacillus sp. NRS-1366]|uniref:zinc-dependent alcohol dehydrogenase n=1 Tax=Brevibacillus sp. NRS-1366 TaxID=3233899 RepID=UPI003D1CC1E1
MKALVKTKPGPGHLELLDIPEPACPPEGVKIKIAYSGICGTDLHIRHDSFPHIPPVVLGHEFAGVVDEVGEHVSRVKHGDRVLVLPSTAVTCGTCEYCKTGYYWFCSGRRGMGIGVNGSFTQYAVVREDMVFLLPEHLSLEEAALGEAFAAAVQAIEELTTIGVGDTVLLSGPGPIGLLCLALLRLKGCKTIVAGTNADSIRLAIAREMGADLVVNVEAESIHAIIERETAGKGVDVAVECAGAGASVATCLKAVKKLGRYVQVGILGKEIMVDFDTILYKQLQVFGSGAHSQKTWEKMMRILEQGKVDLSPIITHKIPLSDWEHGFVLCERKEAGKVLLYYDQG